MERNREQEGEVTSMSKRCEIFAFTRLIRGSTCKNFEVLATTSIDCVVKVKLYGTSMTLDANIWPIMTIELNIKFDQYDHCRADS
ncbi:hypothetical protein Scep_014598 [Stephania cephalantha]|uniref:Uncharacterized protein n=1 Tax=Stephania cephalantha TaxID=152367 RepID=A0AAP0NZJ4_9MAGN